MAQSFDQWETVRIIDKPRQIDGIEWEMNLLFAEFKDDEYIHIEVHTNPEDAGASLSWSSSQDCETTIAAATQTFGETPNDNDFEARAINHDGSEVIEGNPAEICSAVLQDSSNFRYYNGVHGESLVWWESPRIKMIGGTVAHAVVAHNNTQIVVPELFAFMRSTATPRVIEALNNNPSPIMEMLGSLAIREQ